eukprot:scaffold222345_cov19-Tisochrysis_lutea.AAC.1
MILAAALMCKRHARHLPSGCCACDAVGVGSPKGNSAACTPPAQRVLQLRERLGSMQAACPAGAMMLLG